MSLEDVNKQFQNEQTEKYNMGVQDQLKTPIINTTESSRKCLNCDRKINNSNNSNNSNLYCSKDCETTYIIKQHIRDLIPELEEEIHNLNQEVIPFGPNYKTNYENHNLKILKKELLLDKYKTELGLTNSDLPPNAIPIPKNKGGKKQKKTKKRKWSQKYKKSINCKKPKGFSQKQYCKYGRKKN
jgi:hypothetical protein